MYMNREREFRISDKKYLFKHLILLRKEKKLEKEIHKISFSFISSIITIQSCKTTFFLSFSRSASRSLELHNF